MARTERLERLTASDMFLLLWDDYGWSGEMGALAVLDGSTLLDDTGDVRVDAVRRHLAPRLNLAPRFRQLLYRPQLGLGWPLWVDAPAFDIANHVRVHPVDPPGHERQLLHACEQLAQRRLDPTRPLWELWLLPGLTDQKLAVFLKLHHAIADGAAAAATFGALLDLIPDAPSPELPARTAPPPPSSERLFLDNVRRRRAELARGWSGLTHPHRTVVRCRNAWPAWREVLTEKPAPRTSLNHPVGPGRRLAVVRSELDDLKRIAHDHGAKVNDVVLAAVAGGLRQLLDARGELVTGLVQRAMVTLSHHGTPDAQGNRPGWMMVPLPLGEPDPVRRLERIAAETGARKNEQRPEAGSGMFRFIAAQRLWYRQFPRQRLVNIVVSNVPGPPVPLYLAGAPVRELFPVMPLMGNLTLVVAAISYAGQLNISATADPDRCPDVEVFADGVRSAMRDLQHRSPVLTGTA